MTTLRLAVLLFLSACFATGAKAAPMEGPAPRLRRPIRSESRAVLKGSLSPRVVGAKDLGPIRGTRQLQGITIVFGRSAAQEADLQQLLEAQQDVKSNLFHQWLTPEAFGRRFGMADEDLEATKRWLNGQGFTVTGVSRARDRISFSGTTDQVEAAFLMSFHSYESEGELHFAPSTELYLPAEMAGVTAAVLHLSDFRPHTMYRPSPQPNYTTAGTSSHYLTPLDLKVMYDVLPLSNNGVLGQGQSIAVVGQSYVDLSYGSVVRHFSPGSFLNLTPVLVPGTGPEAISWQDAVESEIDMEYASSMAPYAQLFLVFTGSDPNFGVFDALAFTIDQNLAPVVSISYSECEAFLSQTELIQGSALFEQAASQGQTLVAAAGDAGSTGCAFNSVSRALTVAQQQGLAVGYPTDSPYLTAVGGTQMAAGTFTAGDSNYWAPAQPPVDIGLTLLSYVPEVAWNEGSVANGIFAGGGGASALVPRPNWQAGVPGIPAGSTRLLPDIALQASSENPGFLFCSDAPSFASIAQETPSCGTGASDTPHYPHAGGTSFAAPTFAAMVALLNQSTQSLGQGNVNPTLYRFAADPSKAGAVFHDITSGSIACVPGAARCSAAGQSGFTAGPGYDEATGLGSVDFVKLTEAWPGSSPTRVGTVMTIGALSQVSPGDSDALSVQVTNVYRPGTDTSPTGDVSIYVDGVLAEQHLPLSTGSPQFGYSGTGYTYTAPVLPGSHIIVATYPGDSTHGPSQATQSILVGDGLATGGISLSVGNLVVPTNGSAATTVTVTPMGGYNGSLDWTLELEGGDGNSVNACYQIGYLTVQGVSTTRLSIGNGSACSSALPAAREASRPLKVKTRPSAGWSAAAAALLFCAFLPASRRRGSLALVCLLLMSGSAALIGCGGGSGTAKAPSTSTPNPKPTSYTATLVGHDSVNTALSASTTFTLTLQ